MLLVAIFFIRALSKLLEKKHFTKFRRYYAFALVIAAIDKVYTIVTVDNPDSAIFTAWLYFNVLVVYQVVIAGFAIRNSATRRENLRKAIRYFCSYHIINISITLLLRHLLKAELVSAETYGLIFNSFFLAINAVPLLLLNRYSKLILPNNKS